jgi:hypothetical protein
VELADILLSILQIRGAKSLTKGLVVPRGRPKYVKGIAPREHPKTPVKWGILLSATLIGTKQDL